MRLKNKVSVITGGGSGIGKACALLMAAQGAKVVLAGRQEHRLKNVVDEIKQNGGEAFYVPTDITKEDQVKALFAQAKELYGKIDILYNNAASFSGLGKNVLDLEISEFDDMLNVTLKGTFLACKYVIPYMIENGCGSIINCSSVAGKVGHRNNGAYGAAKAGIELLTQGMALDFAAQNIRVNTVCPSWTECERNAEKTELRRAEVNKMHPLGRPGIPKEIAYAVLYLASDESSWVTGTSMVIDGGYLAQ